MRDQTVAAAARADDEDLPLSARVLAREGELAPVGRPRGCAASCSGADLVENDAWACPLSPVALAVASGSASASNDGRTSARSGKVPIDRFCLARVVAGVGAVPRPCATLVVD